MNNPLRNLDRLDWFLLEPIIKAVADLPYGATIPLLAKNQIKKAFGRKYPNEISDPTKDMIILFEGVNTLAKSQKKVFDFIFKYVNSNDYRGRYLVAGHDPEYDICKRIFSYLLSSLKDNLNTKQISTTRDCENYFQRIEHNCPSSNTEIRYAANPWKEKVVIEISCLEPKDGRIYPKKLNILMNLIHLIQSVVHLTEKEIDFHPNYPYLITKKGIWGEKKENIERKTLICNIPFRSQYVNREFLKDKTMGFVIEEMESEKKQYQGEVMDFITQKLNEAGIGYILEN